MVSATVGSLTVDELEAALQLIAEWIVALYGQRIEAVSLTLEGFYTSAPEYHGILPWVARGKGETRDTLPLRQVRDLAEGALSTLFPQVLLDKSFSRDVRDVARSGRVAAVRVSPHRRIELLARFAKPDQLDSGPAHDDCVALHAGGGSTILRAVDGGRVALRGF